MKNEILEPYMNTNNQFLKTLQHIQNNRTVNDTAVILDLLLTDDAML